MTSPSSRSIIAATSVSTLITTSCFTPLDVIKNTQVASARALNVKSAVQKVSSSCGLRGFWRGLTPALVSSVGNNLIYFSLYEFLHPHVTSYVGGFGFGLSALVSRSVSVFLSSPVEQLRTFIQANGFKSETLSTVGMRATLLRDTAFSATFFLVMENVGGSLGILAGSLTAVVFTHPFDVLKTKLQARCCYYSQFEYKPFQGIKSIYKLEGYSEIARGLTPRLCRFVPSGFVYFSIYNFMKGVL